MSAMIKQASLITMQWGFMPIVQPVQKFDILRMTISAKYAKVRRRK
jgi:hypothetical protein